VPRIAIGIEYDGTAFAGWQLQRDARTIEGCVAAAVSKVADESVTVHAAGRTDAGVHATGQVAHFDAHAERTPRQWLLGVNANLPPDVTLRWVRPVAADFNARRSALGRRYRYAIVVQPFRPALLRARAWWLREEIDCGAMGAAAVHWLGEHDFSAFRAAGCQAKSPRRRLASVKIARTPRPGGALVTLEFAANAFLQHMVRNFVGALTAIGRGELPPQAAAAMLASRDRTQAGMAAPPAGLTLVEVSYPPRFGVPDAFDAA
jgi:tRNA pseudouridine38-40 synthase